MTQHNVLTIPNPFYTVRVGEGYG